MNQRARVQRRRRSNARKKRMLLIGAMVAVLLVIVFLIVHLVMRSAVNKVPKNEIWNHVYIEDVDVSGMTEKDISL